MARFTKLPTDVVAALTAHTRLYLEDPERAHMWDSAPVGGTGLVKTLLLTTRGRKSGQERHAVLLYVEHEGNYLVIGSKGGTPTHPDWYLNLEATPDCEIRVSSYCTKARARTLRGDEREQCWRKVTDQHDSFLRYQARTERQIPVILIEPISA